MEVSKKALIATLIVNILLIAAGVTCLFCLKFSVLSLGLFTAVSFLVLVSSVLIYSFGKSYQK